MKIKKKPNNRNFNNYLAFPFDETTSTQFRRNRYLTKQKKNSFHCPILGLQDVRILAKFSVSGTQRRAKSGLGSSLKKKNSKNERRWLPVALNRLMNGSFMKYKSVCVCVCSLAGCDSHLSLVTQVELATASESGYTHPARMRN